MLEVQALFPSERSTIHQTNGRQRGQVFAWFVAALCLIAPCFAPAQTSSPQLEQGQRIYLSQCGGCHAQDGSGGRGPSLTRPRLLHAPDDDALVRVIQRGIPGTEMPSSWLSAEQAGSVAAYVRALGRVASESVSGDKVRGKEIYFNKGGCAGCHTIGGHGGALGPDLDDIGARRSLSHLKQSLTEPEAFLPPRFVQVRIDTADGKTLTGVRVNEDTFSIQIRDTSNTVHSFWKSELRKIEKQWGRSAMPAYGRSLSATELDDLVAYLASLEGGS